MTNYHVLSRRHPDTGKALDTKYAALPNRLKVYMPKVENEKEITLGEGVCQVFNLEDSNGNTVWNCISVGERYIDVAILKVNLDDCFLVNTIEEVEQPYNENTSIEIASPLYILGFPFERIGGVLSIWKKASVASEPEFETEAGFPYFWVDTATRSGMSGSSVIYYQKRAISMYSETENKYSNKFTKFVGIYFGRIGVDNTGDAQLGKVWKADVIEKLITDYPK